MMKPFVKITSLSSDIDQSKLKLFKSENRIKGLTFNQEFWMGSKQVVSEIVDRNYGSWIREFVIDKVVQMGFLILCLFFRLVKPQW